MLPSRVPVGRSSTRSAALTFPTTCPAMATVPAVTSARTTPLSPTRKAFETSTRPSTRPSTRTSSSPSSSPWMRVLEPMKEDRGTGSPKPSGAGPPLFPKIAIARRESNRGQAKPPPCPRTPARGRQRACEDRRFGRVREVGITAEGETRHEERHRESDAPEKRDAPQISAVAPVDRQVSDAAPREKEHRSENADLLAGEEADDDSEPDRRPEDARDEPRLQGHAGIHEREDRHDEIRNPRVKGAFETPKGRGIAPLRRKGECEEDSGHRGVDTGLRHRGPHHDADRQIGGQDPDAGPVQAEECGESGRDEREGARVEAPGVEDRDHADRDEIVDHRERREEDL